MNYLEWNNAVINHFFNSENDEKEVILYFSEDIIKEIGENNFSLPENGYVEDFFRAIRSGVVGIRNDDYIQRMLELDAKYRQGCRAIERIPFNYPPYLTYLLTFLLPFTSGNLLEGFSRSNFHDIAKSYFETNKLTDDYDRKIKFCLKEIDHLWGDIFKWLFEHKNLSLGYIEKIENPVFNRRYVNKFEYHIIFRKEQEEQLSIIFDENNILPNEPISENKIKELLIVNANKLRLTKDVIKRIKEDEYVGEKLVKRAFNYYINWDGTNRYDYSKRTNDTILLKRGYSRKRLALCLDFNSLSQEIKIKYLRIFSSDGLSEEFSLSDLKEREYSGIEQSLKNPLYSTPVENCFNSLEEDIQLEDSVNRIKYNWKVKDFYLFKRDSQLKDWIEIPQIEYNIGKTLILVKRAFYYTYLSEWFEKDIPTNYKKIYTENYKTKLPDGWIAITVDQITKYQHPSLMELKIRTGQVPKINFNKEFFYNSCIYTDFLPNVWIENVEIESEELIAEYEDGSKLPLKFDTVSKKFFFKDSHLQKKGFYFKLKYGEIEYPRFIKIVEFENKKSNEEIESIQPKRNLIGNIARPNEDVANFFKGIEHDFDSDLVREIKPLQKNPVTLECIFINTKNANSYIQNHNYSSIHKGNILLNYISEKGRISKAEYDCAITSLLKYSDERENLKSLITNSMYDLQNLGYVDYDAEQGLITVNKSSFVIIPTKTGTTLQLIGARDNKFVREIINYSVEGGYFVEVRESSTVLLPQRILIKFKSCNQRVAEVFANHFNLMFKYEEKLFTQFALARAHSLLNWEKFVKDTASLNLADDLEGGKIFDINSLTFKDKPIDFNREISFIRFDNINGYKKAYRLWFKNRSFHIAELHYGLYLYLYLYRELRKEEIKIARDRGELNCYEYKEKVKKIIEQTDILLYDESKSWLGVPITCGLPKYIGISFTLLSGKKPIIQKLNNQCYLIYRNVDYIFCNNVLVTSLIQNLTKKHNIFT
ncbi:MAG TPA: hypothetical protein GX708_19300 [Gallicola sp.]|jgi:hypothetical protein|nr:hypothetical protein [Gallicola sp.]